MALQFIIGLLIIVGIHELGHLLFARLFKIKVESYGIGIPPKVFSRKCGETEYYIGAIPLGGAVKLAGMIDESMEEETESIPEKWEYRSKPAWQRLIVILGGIIFNLFTGIFIYSTIAWYIGGDYLSKDEVNKYGIIPNEIGKKFGFQEGDKVLNFNGENFVKFADIFDPINILSKNAYYIVDRNGEEITITIPLDIKESFTREDFKQPFLLPRMPCVIGKVFPESQAIIAGLQENDQILEIDGIKTPYSHNLQEAMQNKADKAISIMYKRGDQILTTTVQVNSIGHIGIEIAQCFKYTHVRYGFTESINTGVNKAYNVVALNLIGLKKIFTGKVSASKALSGPIGIAKVFGGTFSFINFWNIVGFLSLAIAIMNVLPIPAMDGGHAILLVYEIVTGKRVSSKFLMVVQKIGIALLLSLAIYTTINDIYKIFN